MKAFLLGRNGGLYPTDRVSADIVARLSGKDCTCEITRPRNIGHHRKLFALLALCAEHSSYSTEQILDIMKMRTGLTTQSQLQDGTIVQHPGSISFANMDQDRFEEWWERVLSVVATDIIPNVQPGAVKKQLEDFLG